ncbi:glycoside hydrolase family 5 [Paenibacillus curdlanolyticus YK9]|uniref:Exo-1,3-beta-glucanase D n=1 Tax=Paenibacillus curdlanolyticus YK9 TaxID=717606 RepID=E0IG93_9BACL|nr:glycoside hydrolase family 5 protein [Paenibacillus curdlanolyticus]EFM08495.1 glycoside hydrolase family 5 [Paenibacillus curdlanolyticus YK9]
MKQSKLLAMVLMASMVFGLLGAVGVGKASAAPIGPSDFLKTSGKQIKNNYGSGSTVSLHGTNLGGWLMEENWMSPLGGKDEWTVRGTLLSRFGAGTTDSIKSAYQDVWIQASDLDTIKNMGLNFIRVPIYWENMMNRDGTMKSDAYSFAKLDWLVASAQSRGLYVLLDLHGTPGNLNGWQSSGREGVNELWSNTTYQNWTVQIWQRLATHFKDNPTIAGYDLLNEPVSNNSSLSISQMYDRLYKAVRAIDPDHMIYVEAFGYWNNIVSPSTYGWTNVVYEVHSYDWNDTNYTSQSNSINQWFTDMIWHQNNWNVPVYTGEFTLFTHNDLWEKWLSGLDALDVSWTNWSYKVTSGGNWGLYQNNTNPYPDVNNDSVATIQSKLTKFSTNYFQPNTALINIVKAYAKLNAPSSLQAKANNQYVTAENNGAAPLVANRTAVGTWEKFIMVTNADGTVSFLSLANNKYVSADLNNNGRLIAQAQGIAAWEKFRKFTNADGTLSFQSVANNLYVSADLNVNMLIANRTSISGWEAFVVSSAP